MQPKDSRTNTVGILGFGEIGRALHEVYALSSKSFNVKVKDLERDDGLVDLDVLNIALPFNDSFDFIRTVEEAAILSGSKIVIIHSTVPVGTTKKLKQSLTSAAVCHSPCRGVHPNLFEGIMTFEKIIGATSQEDARLASIHLEELGIKTRICTNSETTELAKLLDTTYYGLCIAFHGEAAKACEKLGADFEDVMTSYNTTYNEGYTKLGKKNVVRPVLHAPTNGIGGHCVVQNAELLKKQIESDVLDLIISYKKANQHE